MPRNFKANNIRGQWCLKNLQKAVAAVLISGWSQKKAAENFGIPRQTLRRHLAIAHAGGGVEKVLGRPRILSEEQEDELVNVIVTMENRLFGLTMMDVRRLTYRYCEINKIPHCFNNTAKCAGEDWMAGFMRRHPEITLRKPEPTSFARASGFNKAKVNRFFDVYESLLYNDSGSPGIPASCIFNADESGFSVCHTPGKILAKRGKRSVGALTSLEKGKTITVLCCMSATGVFVPPLIIFPRVRMKPSFMDHAPTGAVGVAAKTGWINEDLFSTWFDHFVQFVQPGSRSNATLLILDGHSSHIKNLAVITKARENNVIILCLPSHCTHRMQPLDVSFFKALNSRYNSVVQTWLRQHPGRIVTEAEFGGLFKDAYADVACVRKAESGFQKTGLYPCNRHVFGDDDFLAAAATDRQLEPEQEVQSTGESGTVVAEVHPESAAACHSSSSETIPALIQTPMTIPVNSSNSAAPESEEQPCQDGEGSSSCSGTIEPGVQPQAAATHQSSSDSETVPADVQTPSTIPDNSSTVAKSSFSQLVENEVFKTHRPTMKPRTRRAVQHGVVVTSSPYKAQLECAKVANTKTTKVKGSSRTINTTAKERNKTKVKKSDSDRPTPTDQQVSVKRVRRNGIGKKRSGEDSDKQVSAKRVRRNGSAKKRADDNTDDDAECLYCCELFSVTGGNWIQCTVCLRWAHVECAGLLQNSRCFICEMCSD